MSGLPEWARLSFLALSNFLDLQNAPHQNPPRAAALLPPSAIPSFRLRNNNPLLGLLQSVLRVEAQSQRLQPGLLLRQKRQHPVGLRCEIGVRRRRAGVHVHEPVAVGGERRPGVRVCGDDDRGRQREQLVLCVLRADVYEWAGQWQEDGCAGDEYGGGDLGSNQFDIAVRPFPSLQLIIGFWGNNILTMGV